VTFAVRPGEVFSVVGPSGAGKSTLLRTINRLVEPTVGEILLDGTSAKELHPLELRRRVGMVFQLPALFSDTVEDAVLYGVRLMGKDADVGYLLGLVDLAPSIAGRDPQSLSVGQQQRVSIARALAMKPEVLLMDEPTSALDQAARQRIEDLIGELNKSWASPPLPSATHSTRSSALRTGSCSSSTVDPRGSGARRSFSAVM
jgi:putative ABC transport system ATP-binding protein